MHADLARRLHREAHADRPAPSAALQARILAGVAAEPTGLQAAPAGGLQPGGWMAIQACGVVALAVLAFALLRDPGTVPPETGATPDGALVVATPTPTVVPFDDLLADLQTEVRGMAAALVGMPDWSDGIDVDGALALLAPPQLDAP